MPELTSFRMFVFGRTEEKTHVFLEPKIKYNSLVRERREEEREKRRERGDISRQKGKFLI